MKKMTKNEIAASLRYELEWLNSLDIDGDTELPWEMVFKMPRISTMNEHQYRFGLDRFRLHKIEVLTERISEQIGNCRCKFNSDDADGTMHFMTDGGSSKSVNEQGKKQARKHLNDWLEDAIEVTIVDPYLFKRSRSLTESPTESDDLDREHVNQILNILGSKLRVAKFIYNGTKGEHLSPSVTDYFATSIKERNIKPYYFAVQDVHDRVWLKKTSDNTWEAKAIGTSLDGIGKRPTYILDMESEDVNRYHGYIHHLQTIAQESRDEPIVLSTKKKNRVSNSGKKVIKGGNSKK